MIHRYINILYLFAGILVVLPHAAAAAEGEHPAMVSAAHPLAAQAGVEILAAGGGALDAAVAVQTVLGLVEPQSSGIGGGAFLLYYDAESGTLSAYDGRETAPAAVDESLFLKPDGTPKGFIEAAGGGQAVGVPGVLAMLAMAHEKHGLLPWARLFEPGVRLSEAGFYVTPRLHRMIGFLSKHLQQFPAAKDYFFTEEGEALAVGFKRTNPAYAMTLRRIALGGPGDFYGGELAAAIVEAVRHAVVNPGRLSLKDMNDYAPAAREPLCREHGAHEVCGMPPPTSGGVTVLQILGILEKFDIGDLDPAGSEFIHLMAETSRLAYADRARYLGDPAFVDVPVEGLLDPDYLARRAALIQPDRASDSVVAGAPGEAPAYGSGSGEGGQHTSHFSIVDLKGNVVSMTTSVQIPFGSGLMVGGFMLNNELTDFEFDPYDAGRPVANRAEGGKRPLSSMAPTIVFDDQNRPVLAVGSPGGTSIIGYVAQTLLAVLDQGVPVARAVALPHHLAKTETLRLEKGTPLEKLVASLETMGHTVELDSMTSGLHAIGLNYNGGSVRLEGAADPRREGVALPLYPVTGETGVPMVSPRASSARP